jgi:Transposase DDE domain
VISLSDPCSAWTAKANKRVQFGYGLNYLIDTENAVIVDVEATPARTYDEVAAARTMIDRTEERMGLKPAHLAADTAYGTGRFLAWVVARGIAPHIPVWDHSHRNDGTFSRDQFKFDKERNVYICPMGKLLKTTSLREQVSVHGEHPRLRPVSSQVQVLPEHAATHSPARHKRRRSRSCACS